MRKHYYIFGIILLPLLAACNLNSKDTKAVNDTIIDTAQGENVVYENSVAAHDERDTIVGKFDGVNIDTLYVETDMSECFEIDPETGKEHMGDINNMKFYVKSSNPKIKPIEIYGYPGCHPSLVFEGDLDGNGTDEWGYLHTWIFSQWRQYRVYTLKNNRWYHLIYDSLLSTDEAMRGSGYEILEPGPEPGWVKVNYIPNSYKSTVVRDTLLRPTFTPITPETY